MSVDYRFFFIWFDAANRTNPWDIFSSAAFSSAFLIIRVLNYNNHYRHRADYSHQSGGARNSLHNVMTYPDDNIIVSVDNSVGSRPTDPQAMNANRRRVNVLFRDRPKTVWSYLWCLLLSTDCEYYTIILANYIKLTIIIRELITRVHIKVFSFSFFRTSTSLI